MLPKTNGSWIVPAVALATTLMIAVLVLAYVGLPLVGWSALVSTSVALGLTFTLAYLFSHQAGPPTARH
jgi:hypothetical protein